MLRDTLQGTDSRFYRKRYSCRRGKRLPKHLEVLHPNAAGIDLGAEHHYVSVPEGREQEAVRRFGCYTPQLVAMTQWLKQCG